MTPAGRTILDLSRRAKNAEAERDQLRARAAALRDALFDLSMCIETAWRHEDWPPYLRHANNKARTLTDDPGEDADALPQHGVATGGNITPCTCPPGWRGSNLDCQQHFPKGGQP